MRSGQFSRFYSIVHLCEERTAQTISKGEVLTFFCTSLLDPRISRLIIVLVDALLNIDVAVSRLTDRAGGRPLATAARGGVVGRLAG